MSLANFKLSSNNPNDSVGGGGCLCKALGKAQGCDPPYAVFHATATEDVKSPHPVLSVACARAIVQQAASGKDILPLGEPVDMHERLNAEPETTLEWDDLTPDEQNNIAASFPAGSLCSVGAGDYVRIPDDVVAPEEPEPVEPVRPRRRVPEGEPNPVQDFSPEAQDPLLEFAGGLPDEEPGPKPGEYVAVGTESGELTDPIPDDEDVPEV